MLGIMYQPSPEKICTFQAAVMAASQLAESCLGSSEHSKMSVDSYATLVQMLEGDLNGWVEYILAKKVNGC